MPVSIILWGPPGCGKTSLARLYAKAFSLRFYTLSALFSGISDVKRIIKEVEENPLLGQRVLLFIDEIHRFNKAQQDVFLPYVETGTLILIGATTENPSFTLNNALLSRVRVLTLSPLKEEDLEILLKRYETKHGPLPLTPEARTLLKKASGGDARHLFNGVESVAVESGEELVDQKSLQRILQKRMPLFDKQGDNHYNLISALHKAVRTSDPNGALYWLCRILEGGEDPLYIARRLIRMSIEDIGLADPDAQGIALQAMQVYQALGTPEGELALAQATLYLALAPKSNRVYTAYTQARECAEDTGHLSPPLHLLNAPTPLMKKIGYGKGYHYDHDSEEGCSGQSTFPQDMEPKSWYHPVERGFEREMIKRMHYFDKIRKQRNQNG